MEKFIKEYNGEKIKKNLFDKKYNELIKLKNFKYNIYIKNTKNKKLFNNNSYKTDFDILSKYFENDLVIFSITFSFGSNRISNEYENGKKISSFEIFGEKFGYKNKIKKEFLIKIKNYIYRIIIY